MPLTRRGSLLAASLFVVAGLIPSGCGSEGATRFEARGPVVPGGGGTLVYAVPAEPGLPDPLRAEGTAAELVARQIYEPLVARERAPYGRRGLDRGLALSWRNSADLRVWSFNLRPGVEFQDGTPLDGSAVVANAARWRADPAGQEALPGLVAADAPSPDTVRLIMSRQAPRLPDELRDPRLGLVSPEVLEDATGGLLPRADRAGTGPFELRTGAPETLLVRSQGWWGADRGLGPALDQIRFTAVDSALDRAELLREGDVRVAADLPAIVADGLAESPLIAVLRSPAGAVAFERSVRGLIGTSPQPLSSVWLAILGQPPS